MDCERTGGAEFPQSTRFTDGMTLSEPGHCVGPPARASRRGLWVVILALPLFGACASSEYVSLRKTPQNPLADQLQLFSRSGPKPSPRATQVLRRYGLADAASDDSRVVLAKLEKFYEHEPTAEASYALAELAYIGGVKAKPKDKTAALDFYGGAVAHAYKYLFDHSLAYQRNVYDPEFRGACNLYNSALEAMLRIVADKDGLRPGSKHQIHTGAHTCEVCVVGKGTTWRPEEIEKFEFVSDYEVQGLTNNYRNYGLGVPLIAIRRQPQTPIPSEKFYPPGLSVPATAFLRVLPRSATDGSLRAELELYDPLAVRDIDIAGVRVPLESDLSTPLAYFLNEPKVEDLSTLGFLSPEKYQNLRGIYMVQPYEPGKIPVLMVHGLWSSPITWMEMFNDLRSDPRIRERYQFWFYLYPTGQPFWISAAQLRKDLIEARQILDPEVRQPALDQLILVGHSMGGLVSVLQTLESGDDYWKAVSDKPLQEIDTDADTKARLANTFYFHTNPGVRRVITIGTPHRGSTFANEATRYLGRKLVSMPQMLVRSGQQLYRDNPGAFKNDPHVDRFAVARLSHTADHARRAATAGAEAPQHCRRDRGRRAADARLWQRGRRGGLRQRAPGQRRFRDCGQRRSLARASAPDCGAGGAAHLAGEPGGVERHARPATTEDLSGGRAEPVAAGTCGAGRDATWSCAAGPCAAIADRDGADADRAADLSAMTRG
jgi:pimeloyl-ACP methyl ester carboxylesterase